MIMRAMSLECPAILGKIRDNPSLTKDEYMQLMQKLISEAKHGDHKYDCLACAIVLCTDGLKT